MVFIGFIKSTLPMRRLFDPRRFRGISNLVEEPEMIKNYGLHWHIKEVCWGHQKVKGTLLGAASKSKLAGPVDFREQSSAIPPGSVRRRKVNGPSPAYL
jgi:hypothetical protein